jgi:hypothetical protein
MEKQVVQETFFSLFNDALSVSWDYTASNKTVIGK